MDDRLLRVIGAREVRAARQDPVGEETLRIAAAIVEDVRRRGEAALREHAERLGDLAPGGALVLGRAEIEAARGGIAGEDLGLLERTAGRIRAFAEAQRRALADVDVAVPGGRAGHRAIPIARAGCYAPGGRFPLPSSVLMTAVTARAAGVREVWVASPRPTALTLAAAAVAGADGLLAAGGAQAIAALAFGAGAVPACDAVVGPGNRFVTAAKRIVGGRVAIDMLAGPSELLVIADGTADPALVAADLLAQAEHDPDACPMLVTTVPSLPDRVEAALAEALAGLGTAEIARAALRNGFAAVARDPDEAIALSDEIAAEHVEVLTADAERTAARLSRYGGLFVGPGAAEVLGDYGAGPNHVLPTSGAARHRGGLSVLDFLAVRSWLRVDDPPSARPLASDAERLARLEGLEAHARAAALRGR